MKKLTTLALIILALLTACKDDGKVINSTVTSNGTNCPADANGVRQCN